MHLPGLRSISTRKHTLTRTTLLAACALMLGGSACLPGEDAVPLIVEERAGIPSGDVVDRLHYYVSTEEEAPGLYAFRTETPDEPPVLVDPNANLTTFFSATFPIAATEGGSSLHLRPQGVLYTAGETFPPPSDGVPLVKTYFATTDPDQLDSAPAQVSSYESAGLAGGSSYSTFGDSLAASSIFFLTYGLRIDLDMAADAEPIEPPEDSAFLGTMLGENTRTHDHWLFVTSDGTLHFYDKAFSASTAVVDDDTGAPIEGLAVGGTFISHLGVEDMLVLLATDQDEDGTGSLHRVSRPTAGGGGVAKRLLNDGGEPIQLALPGAVVGRTIPGEARRWHDAEAFYFSEGASVLDSETPARVTRVTAEGWAALEVEAEIFAAFTPELLIRVDGGFFWAPNFSPELIYPDDGDPASWRRTPLPEDVPQPMSSGILSSAGDWVYYQSNDDEAVALNVSSNEVVIYPDSAWVGASFSSDIGDEIRTDLLARLGLATVVIHLGDGRLGAVEATDPQAGVAVLGELPASTETVQANGPAFGPARLLRVEHDDGAVEIIAIDSREIDSLRHLMASPAVEWSYETTIGTTSLEMDVDPGATAPLKLF